MRPCFKFPLTLLAIVCLLVLSVGPAAAGGTGTTGGAGATAGAAPVADAGRTMSDWSAWQQYFTPIVPPFGGNPGSPPGRPIPTASPSDALLFAWLNSFVPPLPAVMAHAEEVAKGPGHKTIIGHGPAEDEPASNNGYAVGGELFTPPGTYFETFDSFWGETWRMLPNLWGGYAYRGADSVTFDAENVIKNSSPYADGYSMKIAGHVPFEAGISRHVQVPPNSRVRVRVMYALYDHGGNIGQYDWACLGIKADDFDAEWVNGPWHGQWLPLEHEIQAGPRGDMMIFLQVMNPLPENTNAYFDNVQIWVDGEPYDG